MLIERLKNHKLILSSASPRRQQFLRDLGLDFEIRLKPVEEIYPEHLKEGSEIAEFLAVLKASVFLDLKPYEVLVTGDTVVCPPQSLSNPEQPVLGKPKHKKEAAEMLRLLSGKTHRVISSLCVRTSQKTKVDHAVTEVEFKPLSETEIQYYIDNFEPFDKAGAYGIQEWIGQIGVTKIDGSYFNVMGMPTHLLYATLMDILD